MAIVSLEIDPAKNVSVVIVLPGSHNGAPIARETGGTACCLHKTCPPAAGPSASCTNPAASSFPTLDISSARYLQGLGFKALATTSSGAAWRQGKADGQMPVEDVLIHLREMVTATGLPVNADFEHGFASDAAGVARNVRLAVDTGLHSRGWSRDQARFRIRNRED